MAIGLEEYRRSYYYYRDDGVVVVMLSSEILYVQGKDDNYDLRLIHEDLPRVVAVILGSCNTPAYGNYAPEML